MKPEVWLGIVIVTILMLTGTLLVSGFRANLGQPPEVDRHIDSEFNVICYTWEAEMECFPYNDEGTHLEFTK